MKGTNHKEYDKSEVRYFVVKHLTFKVNCFKLKKLIINTINSFFVSMWVHYTLLPKPAAAGRCKGLIESSTRFV